MGKRSRRASRIRTERELKLYPCSHCDTDRIVSPLSEFVSFSRVHFPELKPAIDGMREYVQLDTLVSLCPGCMCFTSDLSASHSH